MSRAISEATKLGHWLWISKIGINMRLAGNDHFVIKKASGTKTESSFQRYNLVTEQDMKSIRWLDEKNVISGKMDTYMDTRTKTKIV